jgi:hypothetical protein
MRAKLHICPLRQFDWVSKRGERTVPRRELMTTQSELRSVVWLLMGSTGSTPGILELTKDHLSFLASGAGALTKGQLRALA